MVISLLAIISIVVFLAYDTVGKKTTVESSDESSTNSIQ